MLRHLHNNEHPLHIIYNNYAFENNLNFQNFDSLRVSNTFIGTALSVHKLIGKNLLRDIEKLSREQDGIHKNYFAYIQNSPIANSPFTNVNQQQMIRRLLVNNIVNFGDLHREKMNPRFPTLFLDVYQIYNTYPADWRRLITKTNRVHDKITAEIPAAFNKWQDISIIKTKTITKYLSSICTPEDVRLYVNNRHKLDGNLVNVIRNNPFVNLRKTTSDVKLRNIQYKILHNIYPTMKHLNKWKIKNTPNCGHCNTVETTIHAIYECPIAIDCWQKLNRILNGRIGNLTPLEILEGTAGSANQNLLGLSNNERFGLDTVLILLKQKLILQREGKLLLLDIEIENVIKNWMKIERYIAIKNDKLRKHELRWSWIETCLNVLHIPNIS